MKLKKIYSNNLSLHSKLLDYNVFFDYSGFKNRSKALTFDDVLLCPKKSNIRSRQDPNLNTRLTKNIKLRKPLISANMDTITEEKMALSFSQMGGFGILHRFMSIPRQVKQVRNLKKFLNHVGASIGVSEDHKKRARALIQSGADVIAIDVAHGHSQAVIDTLKWLKDSFPKVEVIVGNIVTPEATLELSEEGADAIKVGIGPGSMCTTRVVTGCGMPQLTAISLCADVLKGKNLPLIADGGIRHSGDLLKALASGAQTVMLGSLLAGTTETPGSIKKGRKLFRGMASQSAYVSWKRKPSLTRATEGESTYVPAKGSVKNVVKEITAGLKSGMSYLGASNIDEIPKKAIFMEITSHGHFESLPHGLLKSHKL